MPTRLLVRAVAACLAVTIVAAPRPAFAADGETGPSISARVIKSTLIDPTTYAPAIIFYDATLRDWNSSQPLFQAGFVEHNERFTISGRADDFPLSYGAGHSKIVADSLQLMAVSAAHNAASHLFEEALHARYPNHGKVVTAIGWAERIAVGSLLTYRIAGPHYQQWQRNQQLITTLGIK
jgi:hypothetical protein